MSFESVSLLPPSLLFPFTLSLSIMVARSHSSPSLTFHFPPSLAQPSWRKRKGEESWEVFVSEGTKTNSLFLPLPFSGRPTDRHRGRQTEDRERGEGRKGHRDRDAARPTDLIKMGRKRSNPFFPLLGLTDLGCQILEMVRARG